MKIDTPFIHLFKTPGAGYVYDVNTNSIFKVKESVFKYLSGAANEEENNDAENTLTRMRKQGLLSTKRLETIIHPASDMLPYYLENKLEMLTLQVTQNCNLRCEYCPYSGSYINRRHNNKRMSFEIAKKAIDFYLQHSKDNDYLSVGFYGGEPLLEFSLIQKCVEYARNKAQGKEIKFNLTINGTLLNEKNVEYLIKNDFQVIISLDGPEEIHNKNRKFASDGSGSFKTVISNISKFNEEYPEFFGKVMFNAVMDPSVDFNCLNSFFMSYDAVKGHNAMFSPISNEYLADSQGERSESFEQDVSYEMFKLLLFKLKRLSKKNISPVVKAYFEQVRKVFYKERVPVEQLPDKGHHGGPCIPGVMRLFVSCDGLFYPCEKVSETSEMMKIGDLDKGYDIEKVRKLLNIGQLSEQQCKDCWAFRFCHLCAASCDDLESLSSDKKLSRCQSVRDEAETLMKEYCMLREFGYDFEEDAG